MKTSYDWKIGPIHLVPELRLAWQHEFGQTDYSLVSSFANGAGNSFTVTGAEIGRDSMLLGAGFAIHWNDRLEHLRLLRRRTFPHQLSLQQHLRGLSPLVLERADRSHWEISGGKKSSFLTKRSKLEFAKSIVCIRDCVI